jgi:hypothetical protein
MVGWIKKGGAVIVRKLESFESIDYDSKQQDFHSIDRQRPDDPDHDGLPRSAE